MIGSNVCGSVIRLFCVIRMPASVAEPPSSVRLRPSGVRNNSIKSHMQAVKTNWNLNSPFEDSHNSFIHSNGPWAVMYSSIGGIQKMYRTHGHRNRTTEWIVLPRDCAKPNDGTWEKKRINLIIGYQISFNDSQTIKYQRMPHSYRCSFILILSR